MTTSLFITFPTISSLLCCLSHCNHVAPLFSPLTSLDLAFDPNPTQSGSLFKLSVAKPEILMRFKKKKKRGTERLSMFTGMRATDACWVVKNRRLLMDCNLCVCVSAESSLWALTIEPDRRPETQGSTSLQYATGSWLIYMPVNIHTLNQAIPDSQWRFIGDTVAARFFAA